jgi:Nif-specific regulatory protein
MISPLLNSRYTLRERIAVGGQSELWVAQDQLLGGSCIIKKGAQVREEAFLSRRLNHPYFAAPYDFDADSDGGPFAVFPHFQEQPLLDWIRNRSPEDLKRPAVQIAEALCYLHHQGWLYNDFKPEHFLVGDAGIKIIDLGLCTPVQVHDAAPLRTFSGSFPYIAPERLSGTSSDPRSDIFQLGMVLLHAFFPNEDWSDQPSLPALQVFLKKTQSLNGFWRNLICGMTSFEPGQRIGSAQELWKQLQPTGSQPFLIFPFPAYFSIPSSFLENPGAVFVHSLSRINLLEAQNQFLLRAWEIGLRTCAFDFRFSDLEKCLTALCFALSGNRATSLFSGLETLEGTSLRGTLILFTGIENLNAQDRSMFLFAVSRLSRLEGARIAVLSSTVERNNLEEGWELFEIPALTRETLDRHRSSIVPDAETVFKSRPGWKGFALPEQVLSDLRKRVSPGGIRSAAFLSGVAPGDLDTLNASERRVLSVVAVGGGTVPVALLEPWWKETEYRLSAALNRLQSEGFIRKYGEDVRLTLPATVLLKALRKSQIRQLGNRATNEWKDTPHRACVYFAAKHAGLSRHASAASLLLAREFLHEGDEQQASLWLLRAFDCGARIPKAQLIRLAGHCLRHSRLSRAKSLLRQIRHRFGGSAALLDLALDLYLRTQNFTSAEAFLAKRLSKTRSTKRKNYLAVRLAGIQIHQQKLAQGEAILSGLRETQDSLVPKTRGLFHHYLGLSLFYKGQLDASQAELKQALRFPHPYRATSLMNLGVTYIKMGNPDAEKWLTRAIRWFSKIQDADRLAHAHNNLGVLYKQRGDLTEARKNYSHAIHLAQMSKNSSILSPAYTNIAVTYELEGRPEPALECYSRAIRIARTAGSKMNESLALTNSGLILAFQGRFQRAISVLKQAALLRKELGLKAYLAGTHEYLGITYLLSRHFKDAGRSFKMSEAMFQAARCDRDAKRALLYQRLVHLQSGRTHKRNQVPAQGPDPTFQQHPFELGLYHYAQAATALGGEFPAQAGCRDSIHEAERNLRKAPSLFWLGKLYQLKAEYLFRKARHERAVAALNAAVDIFSRLGARKELIGLTRQEKTMQIGSDLIGKMTEALPYRILLMIKEILEEPNPEEMISRILETALEFTDMERAVLILQNGHPRIYKSATLDDTTVQEICEISRSAMESSHETGKPFLCFDASLHPAFKSKQSILANHIMSIVCLPLRAKDQILGALYLDSREGVESLASTEQVLLEIFASIVSLALDSALNLERTQTETERLRRSIGRTTEFPEIAGVSRQMAEILKQIDQFKDSHLPVLITGETGTGKELVARACHYSSKRRRGPFIAINCSAFARDLLESELFGHEKGAFTGAVSLKKGLFEHANSGTLFLDEVGEMSPSMQAKLLRVLESGEFRRVGGLETLHTNARVILATNRNLTEMIENKEFREDLYYRIRGVQIVVDPLRERPEDIPILASRFLKEALLTTARRIIGFSPDTIEIMKKYRWPGNARQLKSEIERMVAVSHEEWIRPNDLDPQIQKHAETSVQQEEASGSTLRQIEKDLILRRLEEHRWSVISTARSLGLSRHGLYSKMRRHSIPPPRAKDS